MCPAAGKIVVVLTLLLGIGVLPQAGGQDPKKEQPKLDAKKVAAQKKTAADTWTEVFQTTNMPLAETAHFLVVGGKAGMDLAGAGSALEQQLAKACKLLEVDQDTPLWQGKLTVLLLPDAKKYPRMIRVLERRKAEEDETGSFDRDGDFPYIVACAGSTPTDLGAAGNAGLQLSTMLLTVRIKTLTPGWLNEGLGRALVLHSGPPAVLAAERRKALALLAKTNRTADDVFNNNLNAEEQPFLRASLADCLAYSGKVKFLSFLDGLRADENGNDGNVQTALKNVNLTSAELTFQWHKYAKSLK